MKEIIVSSIRPVPRRDMRLSISEYLDYIGEYLNVAASRNTDVACLPECFPDQDPGGAEEMSGSIIHCVAEKARATGMNVVAPLIVRVDTKKFIAALWIDRRGQVTGIYHKIHPTRIETQAFGVSPGDRVPVLNTDLGPIGIMICFDGYFPEIAAMLSRKGARIIFYPHRQNTPGLSAHQLHIRARAMDNCVYVVTSTCGARRATATKAYADAYPSYVVGPDGELVAASGIEEGVLTACIDTERKWFVSDHAEFGTHDMKAIHAKYRRPDVYQKEDVG